jgi:Protein of unknown function (DUF2795)
MLPRAEPKDWEEVLELLEFPASLSEINNRARDIGGIDHEVHEIIGRLPRDSYDSLEDFLQDVRQVYLDDGIAPDKLPL